MKFHLHLPRPNGDWKERSALVTNIYAIEEAFRKGRIKSALVQIKGKKKDRYVYCDNVRPVGVWTPNNLCSSFLGFSLDTKLGEERVEYENVVRLTFHLA